MTPGLEILARSMARVMGAWLGPSVEPGETHTIASASLLVGKKGTWSRWAPGLPASAPRPHAQAEAGGILQHLTNWHSPSLTVTVTLLPAFRELPEMVRRVPPEAGPRLGLTRSKVGVWGRRNVEG